MSSLPAPLNILGIESSCDDTCAAVVTSRHEILSNIVISQNSDHAVFQGVVPEIAARSHMQNLEIAIRQALAIAKIELQQIDGIAATAGPGLIGGVIVGSVFARSMASVLKKPFIAVNHLEGHTLTARLTNNIPYPYLLLLVSGGHCQFVAVENLGKYKILGQTLDDAVGEAFDKVGKMLGLPFPGGPQIEARAQSGDYNKYILPQPMIKQKDCNMSFSGLKTAVKLLLDSLGELNEQNINDIAASFQYTVGSILSVKMRYAIERFKKICDSNVIVVAGGVAANQYLKHILSTASIQSNFSLIVPPMELCTDNAAMIAYVGLERLKANLVNNLDFCPRARWSLEEL